MVEPYFRLFETPVLFSSNFSFSKTRPRPTYLILVIRKMLVCPYGVLLHGYLTRHHRQNFLSERPECSSDIILVMNNSLLKTIATIALLAQIIIPVWWATVFASFYYFWVEGVVEGGDLHIGSGYEGNLLWGIVSIYGIIAIVVSIYSLFFTRKGGTEQSLSRKKVLFLVINLITIAGVVATVALNRGIVPRL